MPEYELCPVCHGYGYTNPIESDYGHPRIPCLACNKTGQVPVKHKKVEEKMPVLFETVVETAQDQPAAITCTIDELAPDVKIVTTDQHAQDVAIRLMDQLEKAGVQIVYGCPATATAIFKDAAGEEIFSLTITLYTEVK